MPLVLHAVRGSCGASVQTSPRSQHYATGLRSATRLRMCDLACRRDEKSRPAPWKMSANSKRWAFPAGGPCTMFGLARFVLAAALALSATVALGQGYPNRPIKLIVAFPPGGATDVIARVVGQPL